MMFRVAAAAALMVAASSFGAPFSHRQHLALKLQCLSCHTGVTSSTQASDNNLPSQRICRNCHQQDMPVMAPEKLLVTRFDHRLHARLGNIAGVIRASIDAKTYLTPATAPAQAHLTSSNACAACHRGIETSEAVARTNLPQMADCLVCHSKIDNPFSCELCHAPGNHLKPASHVRGYQDLHSTGRANLDKASCVLCHGRRFTCLGCH